MAFPIKADIPEQMEVSARMRAGDLNGVFRIIQNFYALVKKAAVSPGGHIYLTWLRKITFIPFGGPNLWNRKTELMFREIERAEAKHYNEDLHPNLEVEWKSSGLEREVHLHGNIEIICSRCGR
jgi:hypothetical protein